MPGPSASQSFARRLFVSRLGAAFAVLTGSALTPDQAFAAPGPWQPTRHAQDDWLDAIPGQHRFFFDTATALGAGEALQFVSNYLYASQFGYSLGPADNAIVLCLRHWSTPFAFSDVVWAKYGSIFSERIKFVDPKTNAAPVINVYLRKGYGMQLPNRENTLAEAPEKRVHFAVCDMATKALAGLIAGRMSMKSEEVYAELRGSAHANSHFVPAGIVAVNRAQERGYAIHHLG
jgi:intracellular sulfur oxidation DsrE/DsrF family protein